MELRARADVVRNGFAESVHQAVCCVCRADGEVLLAAGDPERPAFPRSSLKPLQALTPVADGAPQAFGLTEREIAVFCGSHSGEPFHVEAVMSILAKSGLTEDALQCGAHWPCESASEELRRRGQEPRAVHNNCSGKHAGMLSAFAKRGLDASDYLNPESSVQLDTRRNVAAMTDTPFDDVIVGVDGCAAPTLGVPIRGMALAFARVGAPEYAPEGLRDACGTVLAAMKAHPEMVAGTGRNCTRLSLATGGQLVVKSGAEAFFAGALPKLELGIAVKILDGGARASAPIALACLRELGIIERECYAELEDLWAPPLKNCRGDVVGEIRAVVEPRG